MYIFVLIILFTLFGSVFSLIGGVLLLLRKNWNQSFNLTLTSFAAGVLLATAFLDLFPEALEEFGMDRGLFIPVLCGMVSFFLLERFLWFHHHHKEHSRTKPSATLVIVGDSIHNFIDGVAIAAGFLVSIPLGITTALAVAAHEIPQEIADFSILLNQGFSKKNTLMVNLFSSLTALIAAVVTFVSVSLLKPYLGMIVAFTAGMFIYIASSDLIPELHHSGKEEGLWRQVSMFLLGIASVAIMTHVLKV